MAAQQKSPSATTPTGRPRRTHTEIEEANLQREIASMHRLEARLIARRDRARGLVGDSPKKEIVEKPARQPNQAKRKLENRGGPKYIFVTHTVPRHVMLEALNAREFAGGLFVPITNTGGTAAEFFFPDPLLDPAELFEVECLRTSVPSHVVAEYEDWEIYVAEDTEEEIVGSIDRRKVRDQVESLSVINRETMFNAILHRLYAHPGAITDEEDGVLEYLANEELEYRAPHKKERLSMFM